ncbi:MAG: hypothetical protein MUP81_02620 [Dehalococcoidia bacterium]|nr:hypothetical protein [Dehalococcoidia bacterium]
MKGKSYFLSFVEECIMDPSWAAYVGGRIAVYEVGSDKYAIEEIRFLTKKQKEYRRLRRRYDFEDVTKKGLERLRKKIVGLNEKDEA